MPKVTSTAARALKHSHGMELWIGARTIKKFEAPED
jgi:hypothetical protein